MTQNPSSKPTVAIIGLGAIGRVLATNLTKGNRFILVADRTLAKAQDLASTLGPLARPLDIHSAIQAADILVLAIWFDAIKEFLGQYATTLEGKILIDPSNPIAPDGKGGFVKKIGEKESAGQLLSALIPKGARLAKALGTLGAASLASAAFGQPPAVLFYATNDTGINGAVEELIRDTGFEPLRIGGLEQSIRIEVFGDLHEFGGLGKPVTAAEAGKKAYLIS